MSRLHLRYDGNSIDMSLSELDLGDLSTDTEVRAAVAESQDVPVSKLAGYVVDRNDGDITLRPQATFGS